MENILKKIPLLVLILLLGISLIYIILFFTDVIDVSAFISLGYVYIGLTLLITIVYPIMFMISEPKKAIKALAGVALFGILFGIGYVTSKGGVIPGAEHISETQSKMIGAEINTVYILIAIAIGAMVITPISRLFK